MVTLSVFVPFINGSLWFTQELSRNIFGHVLQQAAEKIDRVRECAGKVLLSLLYDYEMAHLHGREVFDVVLPRTEMHDMNWLSPADVFHRLVKLLVVKEYRFDLLTGLVVSVGGMTESLVRFRDSFFVQMCANIYFSGFRSDTRRRSSLILWVHCQTTPLHGQRQGQI